MRKPPPMPNRPDTKPTTAPSISIRGQFTETSAIGRYKSKGRAFGWV